MANIPEFIDNYHLPPGEHSCTMADIESRFLSTETRLKRWNNFLNMLERICELKLIPETIIINGSFVTGRNSPGDVDFAAYIAPDTIREALKNDDDHDVEGVRLFLDSNNQVAIRNLLGAHLLVADSPDMLEICSDIFRKGLSGQLREPDPDRDPHWVSRPSEKGILKVNKTDILSHIGGGI